MANADDKKLAAYYREAFDFDPDKLTDEQKAKLSEAVARIETAQGRPYVMQPDGRLAMNPDLERLQQQGIPRSTARMLSLWRFYKAGILPDELESDRLVRGGVRKEDIARIQQERADDFKKRAPAAYAQWEVDDPQETPTSKPVEMEPESIEANAEGTPANIAEQQPVAVQAPQGDALPAPSGPAQWRKQVLQPDGTYRDMDES